ncbi:hypothetical protein [Vibrio diabolicus]|uniref:hypothetical protein n=1 Tax=Vibrio diabolicus TaxID=50719 RepID=UPI00193BD44F|nr:hypothetical protein [Vibrio diabolicus]EGQ9696261.1 hypothetical protein [Vibrio parahaemolyticus]EJX1342461.1 hypothetical protein [Vibrio parahaemolyticus]
MELLGKTARKFGVKSHAVSQNLDEYLAYRGKNAAYKDWLYKLSRNDQLPRGRFFKGKKAGKPIVLIDECWQFLSKTESLRKNYQTSRENACRILK